MIKDKISTHYYWLDLLRFIAAFIVVVSHVRQIFFVTYIDLIDKDLISLIFYTITRIGNEAVIVFFVLSGFLVGGKSLEKIFNNDFNSLNYFIDRAVRILLPLIPTLIFTSIVSFILYNKFDFIELVGNLLSLQGVLVNTFGGNGPLWSLSYEVWFYFLIFIIGKIVFERKFNIYLIFGLIVFLVVFTKLYPIYLFCWLIGILVYLHKPAKFSLTIFIFSLLFLLYSILGVQVGYASISYKNHILNYIIFPLDISRLLLSISFGLLIQQLILLKPKKIFFITLNNIGSSFSKSSYTLYLSHYPLLMLINYLGVKKMDLVNFENIIFFICLILICLIFAFVMYLFFEKNTYIVKSFIMEKIK